MEIIYTINKLNTSLFFYLNGFGVIDARLDAVVSFAAKELGFFLIFAAVVFLVSHTHPKEGLRNICVVFFSAILAWAVSAAIKYAYHVPRPFEIFDNVRLLFLHGGGDSFPSGHATFFAALAASLFAYHKRLGVVYAFGALLIGVARVMAGVHFPVDILAGYILGGIIGFSVFKFFNRY